MTVALQTEQTRVGMRSSKRRAPYLLPSLLIVISAVLVIIPTSLSIEGKWSLFGFLCAVILWTTTKINSAYIALGTVLFLIVTGGTKQEVLFESLASDIIWLMIGSFILGGALQVTGLAEKLTNAVVSRADNVGNIFWLLTAMIQILAFFIPSTSGRAAVVLPVFQSLSNEIGSKRITKAMAILIPTIILVSTSSTIIGAGSHFIALDLLKEISNKDISFVQWVLWGLPFGMVASAVSCKIILSMFLKKEEVKQVLCYEKVEFHLSKNEKYTLIVLVGMILLWLSESLHGIEIATTTIIGAFLLTLPAFGVLSWKAGVKSVSWNLIIFVAAAMALGTALIESGAADWIMKGLFSFTEHAKGESTFLVLLVLVLLSVTSHLYMTSHTTRAIVFVPPLLSFAASMGLNEVAVLFIGIVGMNYCLTFPVSSKAILLFQENDGETFQPRDLLRLSGFVGIAYAVLMVVFYYGYWKWAGLAL
ncbi:SLC13 family permease [Bacillus manliponensis]